MVCTLELNGCNSCFSCLCIPLIFNHKVNTINQQLTICSFDNRNRLCFSVHQRSSLCQTDLCICCTISTAFHSPSDLYNIGLASAFSLSGNGKSTISAIHNLDIAALCRDFNRRCLRIYGNIILGLFRGKAFYWFSIDRNALDRVGGCLYAIFLIADFCNLALSGNRRDAVRVTIILIGGNLIAVQRSMSHKSGI